MNLVAQYAIATFLIVIIPGQGMAMVLRQTLLGSRQLAFAAVAGNTSGLGVWGIIAAAGLSALFETGSVAYSVLKFTGISYLLYVAVTTARTVFKPAALEDTAQLSAMTIPASYRLGLFTNLTNIKAAIYALAFTPNFIPDGFDQTQGIAVLIGLWMLISAVTYSVIVFSVSSVSHLLQSVRSRRIIAAITSSGMVVLALGLFLN